VVRLGEYSSWVGRRLLLGTASVALTLPAVAHAQASGNGTPEVLEEIVVTAQKREERLLDVPLAITAFTGVDLERRNASSLQDLQYSVPGLSLIETGPGQQRIQIRGISNLNGLPTVGQYLDEMPISIDDQTQNAGPRLIDMKQVEVLRGPQGTLYGEGSMGGTIRFLTADPNLQSFGGNLEAQAGSVADGGTAWKLTGVVNLPLVEDRVGLRLVAGYEDTGGWIDNTVTGRKDVNKAEITTVRGKLLAKLTDNLEASLLVLHQEQTQDAQNYGEDRKTAARVGTRNNPEYDLVNAIVRLDLGGASLVNSFGYQNARNDTATDYSAVFVPILPFFGFPVGFITSVGLGSTSDIKVYSNELRLASKPGGVIDWSVGLYGRKLDRDGTSETFTAPGTAPFTLLKVSAIQKSKAWAAFGEVTWHANEDLEVTGGLRYFHEERTFSGVSTSFGFSSPQTNSGDFSTVNPRLNIAYKLSPTAMVYASAAKGFRSGGFNSAATNGPPTYDPDNLWTYEVGTKHSWFDRRVTFEAAAYYNDWKDVQSSVVPIGASLGYIANGGKVQGFGADVQVTARPAPGLTLSATYGWNNLEYKSASAEHAPGDPVDYAVQESWSGSVDYRRPVFGDVQGFARLDYQHAGPSSSINRKAGVNVTFDARDLLNAQLGLDFGRYEVALFVTNLADDDTPIVPGGIGILSENLEQTPRIVGVNFRARF
jgi:iron complex outermembrane receptor protein